MKVIIPLPLVIPMMHLRNSGQDVQALAEFDRAEARGMRSGWWILPSALMGLTGWIAIFHAVGIL